MSANTTALIYAEETTLGTAVPMAGPWAELAYSSESLTANVNTITSDLIVQNRMLQDLVQAGVTVGGDVSTQMGQDHLDKFISAAMCNNWDTSGATFDVLKTGSLSKGFTMMKLFDYIRNNADAASLGLSTHAFSGLQVNQFSLTSALGAAAQVQMSMVGRQDYYPAEAERPVAANITAAPAVDIIGPCEDFAGVKINNTVSGAIYENVALTINNNITSEPGLGTCGIRRTSLGNATVTLSLTAAHDKETELMFRDARSDIANAVSFTLMGSSKTYEFKLPNAKANPTSAQATGQNTPNKVTLEFTALLQQMEVLRSK